ncbi:hypothetical protein J6590_091344 [Homalodisca vitripennis]|nr:hypothetical protein J6590_091344 [Homalodisca vitripennis]
MVYKIITTNTKPTTHNYNILIPFQITMQIANRSLDTVLLWSPPDETAPDDYDSRLTMRKSPQPPLLAGQETRIRVNETNLCSGPFTTSMQIEDCKNIFGSFPPAGTSNLIDDVKSFPVSRSPSMV